MGSSGDSAAGPQLPLILRTKSGTEQCSGGPPQEAAITVNPRYPILDVTQWEVDRSEPMGTKEKDWRFDPRNGRRWLCKLSRINRHTGTYAGEDWSEKIAAEIAESLGLPHAVTELAMRDGRPGIISLDFVSDPITQKLTHGNELMVKVSPNYPMEQKRRLSLHTVANVLTVLSDDFIHLPSSVNVPALVETPTDMLVGYLMLDALIGNTDRHHENWAIVERQTESGEPRFAEIAPTFDHASSLGRELTDEGRLKGMAGEKPSMSPEGYMGRARSAFYRDESDDVAVSPLEAFHLCAQARPHAAMAWLKRLTDCTDARLAEIVEAVPPDRMSSPAHEFAVALLQLNREALLRSEI